MNKYFYKCLYLIIFGIIISNGVLLSESNLLFAPLEANTFEPRVGSLVQTNTKKLRLDIGTTIPFYYNKLEIDSLSIPYSINADFMTYTRLRSQSNFKFPVETSDYYFGLSLSFRELISYNKYLEGRMRLAHISSHIVDGYLKDDSTLSVKPFVYSREFLETNLAYNFEYFTANIRPYIGLNYIFSRKPKDANSLIPNLGFDGNFLVYSFDKFELYFSYGYDFKLVGFDDIFSPQHSLQLGLRIKFRNVISRGIGLNYYLYDGKSIHGMFYNQKDSYSAIGFQIYL